MAETIEELERRRDLLKEIAALANEMPSDDEINEAAEHLMVLKEIAQQDPPSDDEIKAAADHLETLRAIGQADPA